MSTQVGKDAKDLGELVWVGDLVPLKLQLQGVKSRVFIRDRPYHVCSPHPLMLQFQANKTVPLGSNELEERPH